MKTKCVQMISTKNSKSVYTCTGCVQMVFWQVYTRNMLSFKHLTPNVYTCTLISLLKLYIYNIAYVHGFLVEVAKVSVHKCTHRGLLSDSQLIKCVHLVVFLVYIMCTHYHFK